MATISLPQIIQDPIQDLTPDLVFLLEQWQCDLRGELHLSLLSWSDHTLVALGFIYAAPHLREAGTI